MKTKERINELLQQARSISDEQLNKHRHLLLLAPHQDDETLGCAGLIQRFRELGTKIHLAFLTDGSMSHPHSPLFDSSDRTQIRNEEAVEAARRLGIHAGNLFFLNGPDSALPHRGEEHYASYREVLEQLADKLTIDLLLAPYRLDPHCDHRAAYQLASDLSERGNIALWQYPIWIYELGKEEDLSGLQAGSIFRLELTAEEQSAKWEALLCHRSQLDAHLFNDPDGFILHEDVLQHFNQGNEYFIIG